MKLWALAIGILTVAVAGCAVSEKNASSGNVADSSPDSEYALIGDANTAPDDEDFELLEEELDQQMIEVPDPLEPLNRLMFGVNDVLYFWVLEPCAKGCKAVLPQPVRLGIRNFFNNLATPIRLANCLLQGKGDAAGNELNRFLVNTTVGVLGFGDPAKDKYGLEPAQEDLGQTLAVYGLGNGCYIVLPFLGPSSLRDGIGFLGDQFLNPIRCVDPTEVSIAISVGKNTNENSFRIGEYQAFKAAAVDPYVAMRGAYIQYRDKQIKE